MTQHDADKVIGRVRNDGGWDRRYRARRLDVPDFGIQPAYSDPSDLWRKVVEIVALTVYVLVLFGTLLFLAAYFAVWMPVEVMAPR